MYSKFWERMKALKDFGCKPGYLHLDNIEPEQGIEEESENKENKEERRGVKNESR